jgi:hypothetical protein
MSMRFEKYLIEREREIGLITVRETGLMITIEITIELGLLIAAL